MSHPGWRSRPGRPASACSLFTLLPPTCPGVSPPSVPPPPGCGAAAPTQASPTLLVGSAGQLLLRGEPRALLGSRSMSEPEGVPVLLLRRRGAQPLHGGGRAEGQSQSAACIWLASSSSRSERFLLPRSWKEPRGKSLKESVTGPVWGCLSAADHEMKPSAAGALTPSSRGARGACDPEGEG